MSTLRETRENLEYIVRHNLFYNLSITDYAKLCNKSVSSFNREFKTIFKQSPLKWINRERLEYARLRLLTTDESINDIALQAGFESPAHFNRSFKKEFGLPPLRFKMSNQAD